SIKQRFRPFLAELLASFWEGHRVISLGTEAFQWFSRYAEPGAAEAFWAREDRYEAELPCVLVAEADGRGVRKPITVAPLPHPSPLTQRGSAGSPSWSARRPGATRAERGWAGAPRGRGIGDRAAEMRRGPVLDARGGGSVRCRCLRINPSPAPLREL